MKALQSKISLILIAIIVFPLIGQSQEYDDVYFRKSDRKKAKKVLEKDTPTYGVDSHLYDEIDNLDGEEVDGEFLSEYRRRKARLDRIEEVKRNPELANQHIYSRDPYELDYYSYQGDYWSDPYRFDGIRYGTGYYNGYRSPWRRPGWNVSIAFGNRWNRPYWRSGYYREYYYGSTWSYNDPFYGNSFYNNYWCPSPYYGGRNVIVYRNNNADRRAVTRSRRASRNSDYTPSRRQNNSSSYGGFKTAGSTDSNINRRRTYTNSSGRTYEYGNSSGRRGQNYKSSGRSGSSYSGRSGGSGYSRSSRSSGSSRSKSGSSRGSRSRRGN